MHPKFESLAEGNEFIVLNNIVFNTNHIKDNIVKDFKPNNCYLNFCKKNKFLRKYFREVNTQGIFNRIEWKYGLKKDVQCELITFDKMRQLDELQIRIILDFSSILNPINNRPIHLSDKENHNSEYLDLKIFLDFSLRELEAEKTPKINSIENRNFQNVYEQNTAYFHSFSSEEVCI